MGVPEYFMSPPEYLKGVSEHFMGVPEYFMSPPEYLKGVFRILYGSTFLIADTIATKNPDVLQTSEQMLQEGSLFRKLVTNQETLTCTRSSILQTNGGFRSVC
jgi:hypothetical protein